jgi:class 3 adenylate cyclase
MSEAGDKPAAGRAVRGRRRLRLSISATLVLGYGALVVIAVGAVLLITLGAAQTNTRELLRTTARQQVDAVVTSVSATLAPARAQASFLADLIAAGEIDAADDARLKTVLLGALAAAPQISGTAFIRTDLSAVRATRTDSSFDSRVSRAPRPDARQVLTAAKAVTGPSWGRIVYLPEFGDTQITLLAPVRRGKSFQGAVVSVVSIANLSRSLPRPDGDSVAFILTEEDRVVAHPALVGGPRGVSADKPLLKLTEIGDPVLERIWSAPERDAFRGPSADDGFFTHMADVGGEEYAFLYRRIEEFGDTAWIVGAYVKSSVAMPVIDRIRWAAIATSGILLASVLLSILLSRAILRPVRELAQGAEAVSRLEFEAVRPLKGAMFREIDAAMSAFNAMLGGLRLFATYVPRSLVRRLLSLQGSSGLRPEEREVTVLFTDIAGFTEMSRRLTPLRLAAFLNRHFGLLGQAIEAEGGTIDKYIGDSVMAFWGAPDRQPDHAERGCRAALAMAEAVSADNARRAQKGRAPIRLRIGLHSGPAIVGNIGAPGRINYTLVGDTVNVAQRLEQLGKRHAQAQDVVIVASRAVLERAGTLELARSLGPQDLSGRGAMEVFQLAPPALSPGEAVG